MGMGGGFGCVCGGEGGGKVSPQVQGGTVTVWSVSSSSLRKQRQRQRHDALISQAPLIAPRFVCGHVHVSLTGETGTRCYECTALWLFEQCHRFDPQFKCSPPSVPGMKCLRYRSHVMTMFQHRNPDLTKASQSGWQDFLAG